MESIVTSRCAIHFNYRAYESLEEQINKANYSKVFILVDENTNKHCLPQFSAQLDKVFDFEVIEIEAGEAFKNIDTCTQVWEALSELDADRRSLLINLGGGVITDLGGFVASTFKRGIDFINVPTTLLAMVDASIGGKTGVDLGSLKNQIGVINEPAMVLVITPFLRTLEERQWLSGFAEMLKHGLIESEPHWAMLRQVMPFDNVNDLIYDSIQIKNGVVSQDPNEKNLRKILNFGHTLGHAIESYFLEKDKYHPLLHGEAIVAGMILESFLSHKLLGLGTNQLDDIKATLLKRYKRIDFEEEDIADILELLKFDKKNTHGNINFVLIQRIGEAVIDNRVPKELFAHAFAYYKE
ncbi:MAG: 3-dehydroquinate synthase [Flavobacteriaceae bacterium]